MTPDLPPYPAYKPSGIPWLGEIPAHWEVRRLRNAVDMRVSTVDKHAREDEAAVLLCNYVDVYKNDRITERLRFMRATAQPDEIRQFRLERGDVLITKDSEMWNDIGVPALVEYAAPDLVCGYHLAMLRPKSGMLEGEYLFRALQCPTTAYQFHVEANGVTRYGLSHGSIKSVCVPTPPLPEQHAIARYLDYSDRRIRRYIRAKQKLIGLLNEQKQAIIQQAVTRGLDPTVRLKPSGVAWLGDVPEHWEVMRIKNQFDCLNTRRIPLSGVERGRMTVKQYDYYGASGVIDKVDSYLFDDELLLIAEDGANLILRNLPLAIIARGKFWVNNHAHILKLRRGNIEYYAGVLESINYLPWISGAAQPKLTKDRLMAIYIPVPPNDEQNRIMNTIFMETSALRDSIERTHREISLLREYRTRLIADVVTGKVDVRAAAAGLPDEELAAEVEAEAAEAEEMAAEEAGDLAAEEEA